MLLHTMHCQDCSNIHKVSSVQALESAPPPKVERVHDSMSKPFHDFAKEAEKLSPLAVMSEQTKVRTSSVGTALTIMRSRALPLHHASADDSDRKLGAAAATGFCSVED